MQEMYDDRATSLMPHGNMGNKRERICILHVEDDEVDAILAQRVIYKDLAEEMQEYEIEIDFVTSLSKALLEVKKKPYHLILLDLALDDVRGPCTVSMLKNQVPDVPIVVLTGMSDKNVAVESIEDGAADYIMKEQMGDPAFINAIKNALKFKDIKK